MPASPHGTAKAWDAVTGTEQCTLRADDDRIMGVAFSPHGTRLATANRDGRVGVYFAHLDDLDLALARSRLTRSRTPEN